MLDILHAVFSKLHLSHFHLPAHIIDVRQQTVSSVNRTSFPVVVTEVSVACSVPSNGLYGEVLSENYHSAECDYLKCRLPF